MADEDQDTQTKNQTSGDTPEKDPDDWVTGDEPMTGPQLSYLKTQLRQYRNSGGKGLPDELQQIVNKLPEKDADLHEKSTTKANASKLIDAMQEVTGRGDTPSNDDDEVQQAKSMEAGDEG